MKKNESLLLNRSDLKEIYKDLYFDENNKIKIQYFKNEIISEIYKYDLVIFNNDNNLIIIKYKL